MLRRVAAVLSSFAIATIAPTVAAVEKIDFNKIVHYRGQKQPAPARYPGLIRHVREEAQHPSSRRVRPQENRGVRAQLEHKNRDKISNVAVDWYGTSEVSKKPHAGDKTAVGDHLVAATLEALSISGLDKYLTPKGLTKPMAAASALRNAYGEAIVKDHQASKKRGIIYPEVDNRVMWQKAAETAYRDGYFERGILNMTDLQRDMLGLHYEITTNHTWPQPGVKGTFDTLHEKGFPLHIASNAQFYTPIVAQGHGIDIPKLFDSAVYSYRFGHAKPSHALYHALLTAANLPRKGKILYVGNDLLNDIMPIATDPQLKNHFILAWFRGDKLSDRPHEGELLNLPDGQKVLVDPKYADVILTHMSQLQQIVPDRPFGR